MGFLENLLGKPDPAQREIDRAKEGLVDPAQPHLSPSRISNYDSPPGAPDRWLQKWISSMQWLRQPPQRTDPYAEPSGRALKAHGTLAAVRELHESVGPNWRGDARYRQTWEKSVSSAALKENLLRLGPDAAEAIADEPLLFLAGLAVRGAVQLGANWAEKTKGYRQANAWVLGFDLIWLAGSATTDIAAWQNAVHLAATTDDPQEEAYQLNQAQRHYAKAVAAAVTTVPRIWLGKRDFSARKPPIDITPPRESGSAVPALVGDLANQMREFTQRSPRLTKLVDAGEMVRLLPELLRRWPEQMRQLFAWLSGAYGPWKFATEFGPFFTEIADPRDPGRSEGLSSFPNDQPTVAPVSFSQSVNSFGTADDKQLRLQDPFTGKAVAVRVDRSQGGRITLYTADPYNANYQSHRIGHLDFEIANDIIKTKAIWIEPAFDSQNPRNVLFDALVQGNRVARIHASDYLINGLYASHHSHLEYTRIMSSSPKELETISELIVNDTAKIFSIIGYTVSPIFRDGLWRLLIKDAPGQFSERIRSAAQRGTTVEYNPIEITKEQNSGSYDSETNSISLSLYAIRMANMGIYWVIDHEIDHMMMSPDHPLGGASLSFQRSRGNPVEGHETGFDPEEVFAHTNEARRGLVEYEKALNAVQMQGDKALKDPTTKFLYQNGAEMLEQCTHFSERLDTALQTDTWELANAILHNRSARDSPKTLRYEHGVEYRYELTGTKDRHGAVTYVWRHDHWEAAVEFDSDSSGEFREDSQTVLVLRQVGKPANWTPGAGEQHAEVLKKIERMRASSKSHSDESIALRRKLAEVKSKLHRS